MNPADQQFVQRVIETKGEKEAKLLPDLDMGEAIISGQGVQFPVLTRMKPPKSRGDRDKQGQEGSHPRCAQFQGKGVSMLVIAGLSLSNLKPRVWDPVSPYHIPNLKAVMVSYADFHRMPARRKEAMKDGIHKALGIPDGMKVYLDNGAFWFLSRKSRFSERDAKRLRNGYEEFIAGAKPDWHPIPHDFIPTPKMTHKEQRECYLRTIETNWHYRHDGYVPVIHVSRFLEKYLVAIQTVDASSKNSGLSEKSSVALGGIVPNLLRAPKAMAYGEMLRNLKRAREALSGKEIHVFGVGGTSTLHLATLLGMDSADSSGWRNRAARGLVQLPGSGDRMVAELGSWRGRKPSDKEWQKLAACPCPACQEYGIGGLKADRIQGFCNRATHNLWVLLQETTEIDAHLKDGSYSSWYEDHLDNSAYLALIRQALEWRTEGSDNRPQS